MDYLRSWHKNLFEYNLVHSTIAQNVYCEKGFLIAREDLEEINKVSIVISNLLNRIYKGYKDQYQEVLKYIPDFPLKEEILKINRKVAIPFLCRYDTFFSKDGVFFAEFNYDKPCAEREAIIIDETISNDNIKFGFKEKLTSALIKEIGEDNTLAILCNDEYEELHLANLFRKILKDKNINVVVAKKNNFKVNDNRLFCFDKEIKTILRLYPTEELYKVNDIKEILRLFDNGQINIINDPRVIILQSKEVFIYLRKLAEEENNILNEEERRIIKLVIPKTEILDINKLKSINNKCSGMIIKPVLGRYSKNIFVPEFYEEEEWIKVTEYLSDEMISKKYLLQEYKKILGQYIPYYDGNKKYKKFGYGNYGVFIINGEIVGYSPRWCTSPITNEWLSWTTPLKIYDPSIKYYNKEIDLRTLNYKAIFSYNFTGMYTGDRVYLDNRVLTITRDKADELIHATNQLCEIFSKVKDLIVNNIELFKEFLDVDNLINFIKNDFSKRLGCIGRLDWIIDYSGNWKLVEFNSETPAGLNESMNIERLYIEQLDNKRLKTFNTNMSNLIIDDIKSVISEYSKIKPIKKVGILGCTYYEDWYNNNALYNLLKNSISHIEFIQGNIYDLKIENERAYIYGNELDAIYRYFPLDWFIKENMGNIESGLNKNYFFINAANTIITQSKGFLVIVYELLKQGFFNDIESKLIKKYIPFTSFNVEDFENRDYIYKPILGREGQGVEFSYNILKEDNDLGILQDIVESQKVRSLIKNGFGNILEESYPVIGTYIVNDKFAGIYTRVGEVITNKQCQYAPLLIRD